MGAVLHEPLARFMVQAMAIIGLSRLVGLAARRMRQPMVIAEIVAGIALGPSLLGWVAPQVKQALFPVESLGMLGVLSQVGLILFMFLVGLELDPKLLKGRAQASVAISLTSIILPFGLGALIAIYLYPRLAPSGVPFSSFTLFLGVAMSITAFPVLARILVERRLLRTRVGAVTIACAAVDDITAWCVLAFVVAIARSAGVAGAVRTTILALAYVGFMFAAVRPLLRKLGERTAGKDGLSQHVVAAVLIGVLISAWITDIIGIHALFGAFLFGAIIRKEGGLARALAERLEDLVVIFFLPLFFAYSGLRTQIGLLNTWSSWGMCLLIIVVACAGKLGGSMGAARLTGLSWRESGALGILMNTRGLMELVALNIGLDIGVISPALFTMMVLMALVTTFMTSPALEWVYPLSELSKDLVEPAPASIAPRPKNGYTVLACVSLERSGPGMATLAAALLGKDEHNRFYALRLVPPAERASFVLEQQHAPDDGAALRPLLSRAEALSLQVRPLSFVSTQPAEDICNVAGVKRASLVLLGWHKPLIGGALLGGTVHEVMRRATSDVGVLVDRGLGRIERILVPYLGSAHDRTALAAARRIVDHTGATAVVLHVVSPSHDSKLGVGRKVEEVFQERTRGLSAQVVFKAVEHSSPAAAVLEESDAEYDLIIIGVGAEWGLEHRLFGMQAEAIIAQSRTSLLVLRQGSAAAAQRERAATEAAQALAAAAGRS
jgi:Kef-type K+ transport system membrane component KefB/nucleotide-binding universal stress UspA family protein